MLEKVISIVIPCKNEDKNIYDCIEFLSKQKYITGTKIVIADSSDDGKSIKWIQKLKKDFGNLLDIHVVHGGFPAEARFNGSRFVSTQYILFLDADVMLKNKKILITCYENILAYDGDLLTIPFKSEFLWDLIFRFFDFFQRMSLLLKSPFAIGGFQLWKTSKYWKLGGYVKSQLFAEDYWLSSKCDPDKVIVLGGLKAWTSARRFRKKGIFYMFKIMIKSYLNRKNPKFFEHHHDYWNEKI